MSEKDADLEAAFEAGLIETVRREALAVFGTNQTYPCHDVMAMKAEIDRLREQDEAIQAEFDQLSFFLSEWRTEAARLAAENEKLRKAMLKADCYLGLRAPNLARDALSIVFEDKSDE